MEQRCELIDDIPFVFIKTTDAFIVVSQYNAIWSAVGFERSLDFAIEDFKTMWNSAKSDATLNWRLVTK